MSSLHFIFINSSNEEILMMKKNSVLWKRKKFLDSTLLFVEKHIEINRCFDRINRDTVFVVHKKRENLKTV